MAMSYSSYKNLVDLLLERSKTFSDKKLYSYLADKDENSHSVTYQEFAERVKRIAARLQQEGKENDRILLLFEPGIEFIEAYFACLFAKRIAVPLPPPRKSRLIQTLGKILAIADSAAPRIVLTDVAIREKAEECFTELPAYAAMNWIATDDLPEGLTAKAWKKPKIAGNDIAFLQYTSGSTSLPKGVMLSHSNLLHNMHYFDEAGIHDEDSRILTWLPAFHDLGLIYGLLTPIYTGSCCFIISNASFVQRPTRWLQAIHDHKITHAMGPNFSFDLCTQTATDEQLQTWDLSSWQHALNGAEPVRMATMQAFYEKFKSCGFKMNVFSPSWGLAEASCIVTGTHNRHLHSNQRPLLKEIYVDAQAVTRNELRLCTADAPFATSFVSSGIPIADTEIRIVNPNTLAAATADEIGEIWLRNGAVASGYWQNPEKTREVFAAAIQGEDPDKHYMRTGDLGFMLDGEIFITGRMKDLIIIRGQNHYPQDIEWTVDRSHALLKPAGAAAFSIEVDGVEKLAIVAEASRRYSSEKDKDDVIATIKRIIADQHQLQVAAIALIRYGSLPKTTSGKVQRSKTKESLLNGSLEFVDQWWFGETDKTVEKNITLKKAINKNLLDKLGTWLVQRVAQLAGVKESSVKHQQTWNDFGIDSAQAVGLVGELENNFGFENLPATLLFDYPSIEKLSSHLHSLAPAENNVAASDNAVVTNESNVAIIGMACNFPQAPNLDSYWKLISHGESGIRPLPAERAALLDGITTTAVNHLGAAGYIDAIDGFDPQCFGISPTEAHQIDPQQRLLMMAVWHALENANINPAELASSNTGVYVGISQQDYAQLAWNPEQDFGVHASTGMANSIAANRISYWLDLHGPSLSVDTACSSSLVALHLAVKSIRSGECDTAIVAGVNSLLNPTHSLMFRRAGMLSPTNQCHSFDAAADGYVRGEGVGVVILRKASLAQHYNNTIQAFVAGSSLYQDGRSFGLTAPNKQSQVEVIAAALKDAGLSIDNVDYLETHGTGTPLGDPIEINAINELLAKGQRTAPCYLGTVKANIGHLESAAGIAAVIKSVLCLQHQQVPPLAHYEQLNPHIQLQSSLVIHKGTQALEKPVNVVGVTSMGFGGTNAHLVLTKAPHNENTADSTAPAVLKVSAATEKSFRKLTQGYQQHFATPSSHWQDDAIASLQRASMDYETYLCAASQNQLQTQLARPLSNNSTVVAPTQLVWVFAGQGSHYAGMAIELYEYNPAFRNIIDQCDAIFQRQENVQQYDKVSLVNILRDESLLNESRYSQVAIYAVEMALAELLRNAGVTPEMVIGHSLGEYAAATFAGVMTIEEGLSLVAARAAIIQQLAPKGGMLSVNMNIDAVRALQQAYPYISVAAINGAQFHTISAPLEIMDSLKATLTADNVSFTELPVKHPFHHPVLKQAAEALKQVAQGITFAEPRIRIVGNLTAQEVHCYSADYWAEHLLETVLFADSLDYAIAAGVDHVIEISPKPVLLPLLRRHAGIKQAVPSLQAKQDRFSILQLFTQLANWKIAFDWSAVCAIKKSGQLPVYPFDLQSYWIKASAPAKANTHLAPMIASKTSSHATQGIATTKLRPILERLLAISLDEATMQRSFLELGADSLQLNDLTRQVQQQFSAKLELRQLFENLNTPKALQDWVIAQGKDEVVHTTLTTTQATAHEPVASNNATLDGIFQQQLQGFNQLVAQQLAALQQLQGASVANASIALPVQQPIAAVQTIAAPTSPTVKTSGDSQFTEQQAQHIQNLIAEYTQKTSGSKAYAEKFREVFADYRSSLGFRQACKEMIYPLIADEGKGAYITDHNGNRYVDLCMSFGACLLGYNTDLIKTALHQQLDAGIQVGPKNSLTGKVAELVRDLTGVERVAFANSGTEAVMTAIRLARAVTGRKKIVRFTGSYHGHSDHTLVARQSQTPQGRPTAEGVLTVLAEQAIVLDYGSDAALDYIVQHAHDIAAVLVEPVQSRRPGLQPAEFLQRLRALTQQADCALIFDEIITGFRLATGGAQAYFGIKADLVTYGKVAGGGMPLGIIAGTHRFMNAIDGGVWHYGDESGPASPHTFFAGTFSGHPLTMAASATVLSELKQRGDALFTELNQNMAYLANSLNDFYRQEEIPIQVDSAGSLFRFVFHKNYSVEFQPVEAALFFYHMITRGVYIWEGHTCFLSTAHSQQDIDTIIAAGKASALALRDGGFFSSTPQTKAAVDLSVDTSTSTSTTQIPLSAAQKAICLHIEADEKRHVAYNESLLLEVQGDIDAALAQRALELVCQRHKNLQSYLDADSHQLYIDANLPLPWHQKKVANITQAELLTWFKTEIAQPVPFAKNRLIRAYWFESNNQRWLGIVCHHLVIDGLSYVTLAQEWLDACRYLRGEVADLRLRVVEPSTHLQADNEEQTLANRYWIDQLADGNHYFELPLDNERNAERRYEAARITHELSTVLTQKFTAFAKQQGLTPFMALLGVYQLLLCKWCNQKQGVLGVPTSVYQPAHDEAYIGFNVAILPYKSSYNPAQTCAEYFSEIRSHFLAAWSHRHLSLSEILQALHIVPNNNRNPLYDCIFNYEDLEAITSGALGVQQVVPDVPFTKYELALDAIQHQGNIKLVFTYAQHLFNDTTISQLAQRLEQLIDLISTQPHTALGNISILLEHEYIDLGINPEIEEVSGLLHRRFEQQAQLTPNSVAVRFGDAEWTYSELNQYANRVARYLRQEDIGRGDNVAVCLTRTPWLIASLLGVLKTGACYIPIDPKYPLDRQQLIADLGKAKVTLDDNWLETFATQTEEPAIAPQVNIDVPAGALAYIIFTSGSSGIPKGVSISHSNAVAFLDWADTEFPADVLKQTLASTSVCFDLSIFEIFFPLTKGHSIILVDHILDLCDDAVPAANDITLINTVPSAIDELVRLGKVPAATRIINLAGEALQSNLVQRIQAAYPNTAVYNLYGPSEDTTYTTCARMAPGHAGAVPIGLPITGTQLYLLDGDLNPVPKGAIGEVCVAGLGLSQGYFADPTRTAQAFIPNPFGSAGSRLYLTGDLARFGDDGNLYYLGRNDSQVKVRGHRIELGEIEAKLAQCTGVNQVVVQVRAQELVAFLTLQAGVTLSSIQQQISTRLPRFMLPNHWFVMDAMPLTPNGKIDRKALAASNPQAQEPVSAIEPPANDIEIMIADLWKKYLSLNEVGRDQSFFQLGGHSLLATKILADVKDLFGVQLKLKSMMEHNTIADFTQHLLQEVLGCEGDTESLIALLNETAE